MKTFRRMKKLAKVRYLCYHSAFTPGKMIYKTMQQVELCNNIACIYIELLFFVVYLYVLIMIPGTYITLSHRSPTLVLRTLKQVVAHLPENGHLVQGQVTSDSLYPSPGPESRFSVLPCHLPNTCNPHADLWGRQRGMQSHFSGEEADVTDFWSVPQAL